jgi:hypothetical protein
MMKMMELKIVTTSPEGVQDKQQSTIINSQRHLFIVHNGASRMDGYQVVKIHINRSVAVPVVQHRLVHFVLVIRERSIVHHATHHMCIRFYPVVLVIVMKLSFRAPKKDN